MQSIANRHIQLPNLASREHRNQTKKLHNRKKQLAKIFGEHYNYEYYRPNHHKMQRIQETRNTQIQRSNRILLQKIRTIFARSGHKARQYTYYVEEQQYQQQIKPKYQIKRRKPRSLQKKPNIPHPCQQQDPKISVARRRKTQSILKKSHADRVQTVQKKERFVSEECFNSKVTKKLNNYELIYHGQRDIGNIRYEICIVVDDENCQVEAKEIAPSKKKRRGMVEVLKIPIQDYQIFLEQYLNHDCLNLLQYLQIGKQSGLLEVKGFHRETIEVRQSGTVQLPGKQKQTKKTIHESKLSVCFDHSETKTISESRKRQQISEERGNLSELNNLQSVVDGSYRGSSQYRKCRAHSHAP